jgi:integrase
MPVVDLTQRWIEALKPSREQIASGGQIAFMDTKETGLELRLSAKGKKTWSCRYRTREGSKVVQRRLTLGEFSSFEDGKSLTLKVARSKARKIKTGLEDGEDPVAEKKAKAAAPLPAAPLHTFGEMYEAYLADTEAGNYTPRGKVKRARTVKDEKGVWRRHLEADMAAMVVSDITRATVTRVIAGLKSKVVGRTGERMGAQAVRGQQVIRQVLAWAVDQGHLQYNPAAGMKRAVTAKSRSRILKDEEVGAFWRALKDPSELRAKDGSRVYVSERMSLAVRALMLTATRRAEVAAMAVNELDLAQVGAEHWLIPGEKMKGGRPHLVPLSPQAVVLIREALAIRTKKDSPYVFPHARDASRHITPDAISHAVRDVTMALAFDTPAAPHDLRRGCASTMASGKLKVPRAIVSAILGHSSDHAGAAGVTADFYLVFSQEQEKRDGLTAYADYVDRCAANTAEVSPLATSAA